MGEYALHTRKYLTSKQVLYASLENHTFTYYTVTFYVYDSKKKNEEWWTKYVQLWKIKLYKNKSNWSRTGEEW